MPAILVALFGMIGSSITGLFGMKKDQSEVVTAALGTLNGVNNTDAAAMAATAAAINSVYTQGGLMERSWRPMLMWVIISIIVGRWFGWQPSSLSPAEIDHIYNLLYIGIGGYIPLRSFDKMMQGLSIGKILQAYVNKKVL